MASLKFITLSFSISIPPSRPAPTRLSSPKLLRLSCSANASKSRSELFKNAAVAISRLSNSANAPSILISAAVPVPAIEAIVSIRRSGALISLPVRVLFVAFTGASSSTTTSSSTTGSSSSISSARSRICSSSS
ncbi:hypothetical protein ACHAXM_008975 [Skeletonema potamos]